MADATASTNDDAAPRIVVVTDVPPNEDCPNGFAGRYQQFVAGLALRWPTTLVRVTVEGSRDLRSTYPPRVEGLREIVDLHLARRRPTGSAWSDAVRLLKWTALSSSPYNAVAPRSSLRQICPGLLVPGTLVVTFLPDLAHLAFRLPPHVRSIAVLEEGWDRFRRRHPNRRVRLLAKLDGPSQRRRYRRVGREADRIVVVSEREKRYFSRFVSASKLDVVPHGIDLDFFHPESDPGEDIDVLVVGALSRWQYLELPTFVERVDACAARAGRRLRWAFVGGAGASAARLGSLDALVTDHVADVRPFYRRAKLTLVPTFYDVGVRTTLLQSWAMARPAVTTRTALDAIGAPPTLYSIAAESPAQTAEQILRVVDDPALRRSLGQCGRGFVEERHDGSNIGERFAAICHRIVAETAVAPASAIDRGSSAG